MDLPSAGHFFIDGKTPKILRENRNLEASDRRQLRPGYSVMAPAVVIRPILLPSYSDFS